MGRATKWLRGFLGMKKDRENALDSVLTAVSGDEREKKRWSFSKPSKKASSHPLFADVPPNVPARHSGTGDSLWLGSFVVDVEKEKEQQQQSRRANAIAVAAASAAAADAAVAAAEAAVAVARLTAGQGRGALSGFGKKAYAAVKIQCVFRGFLARKALRALRGIVKLQALVRGHLVRKRAATTLGLIQSLFRAQSMVRSQRARHSTDKENQNLTENRPRRSTESEFPSKRIPGSLDIPVDDSIKMVEIDLAKPRCWSRCISSSPLSESPNRIPYSSPLPCLAAGPVFTPDRGQKPDLEWCLVGNDYNCRFSSASHSTAGLPSPASRARLAPGVRYGPSWSCPGVPSYMANTRSSRAKSRSQSTPKQRSEEGSKKRLLLSEIMASRKSVSGVRMDRSFSQLEGILE